MGPRVKPEGGIQGIDSSYFVIPMKEVPATDAAGTNKSNFTDN